jgi:hypothetical protein
MPSTPTTLAIFEMSNIVDDAHNPFGPTATPIITSTITIQGNGAHLLWTLPGVKARAFAVSETGSLTIQNACFSGFND